MHVGTPRDLYENPQNLFVAQFIGSPQMNVMPLVAITGTKELPEAVKVGIRPEQIGFCAAEQGNTYGRVEFTEYLGSDTFVYVACDGIGTTVRCRDKVALNKGETIGLAFDAEHTYFFDVDDNVI